MERKFGPSLYHDSQGPLWAAARGKAQTFISILQLTTSVFHLKDENKVGIPIPHVLCTLHKPRPNAKSLNTESEDKIQIS